MVFLRFDPNSKSDKNKNKWNFIKIKNVYVSKDIIKKAKNQPTGLEKTRYLIKEHVSRMYSLIAQKQEDNPILKWAKDS